MKRYLFISFSLAGVLLFSSCQSASPTQSSPAAAASEEAPPADPNVIKPSAKLLAELTLGTADSAMIAGTFAVAGRIEVNHHLMTRVGSPVMGRISSLVAHEGDVVKRGEVLALVNSTSLSEAQLAFVKAISARQLNLRAVDRAQQLLKADVIGTAELQRREAELAEANAELDAARDQLLLLGMTSEAIEELRRTKVINSVTRVVAPIDGTVIEHHATLGQMMQPADTIFEIANLSKLWLVADVHEQNVGMLKEGLVVEATLSAFPDQVIRGKLSYVSSILNPETRTVQVRMDLPNPSRRYKPSMLATMQLKETPVRQALLPLTAIVREGNSESVFVEKAPGLFQLVPVKVGEEFGGRRVLLEGIEPGQRIVLDGAFHLNGERRRIAVQGSDGE